MGKVCFKCGGDPQPLSNFYKHAGMADGHLNKCKKCTQKDVKKRYYDKPEQIREYERKRHQTDHRKEYIAKHRPVYKQTKDFKESVKKSHRKYRKENPDKYKAHTTLNNAVRDGRLDKEPCGICGDINSQAHHEDYSKPLDVIWLCDKHHKEKHKQLKKDRAIE